MGEKHLSFQSRTTSESRSVSEQDEQIAEERFRKSESIVLSVLKYEVANHESDVASLLLFMLEERLQKVNRLASRRRMRCVLLGKNKILQCPIQRRRDRRMFECPKVKTTEMR